MCEGVYKERVPAALMCKPRHSNESEVKIPGLKESTPYHPSLWISSEKEIDVEGNLRDKDFHTHKIRIRGSLRGFPNRKC